MRQILPVAPVQYQPVPSLSPCEHRTVSKDGRIVCTKIAEGDNTISPSLCRSCPFKAVDCAHLRFSLSLSSPSPLIVRCNGHTEIWDDEPPRIRFRQAACALQLVPILNPDACASCPLRQPIAHPSQPLPRQASLPSRVVPFPQPAAAAG